MYNELQLIEALIALLNKLAQDGVTVHVHHHHPEPPKYEERYYTPPPPTTAADVPMATTKYVEK